MLHVYVGTVMMVLISCSEGLTCPGNQFACEDETRCIPMQKFCDGSKDCRDGSDEPYRTVNASLSRTTTMCRRRKLLSLSHRLCILPSQLITHEEELCDGSTCGSHDFPCADGSQCVAISYFCDGTKNCQDGSDELYHDSSVVKYPDIVICQRNDRICEITTQFLEDKEGFCKMEKCSERSFPCSDGTDCVAIEEFCNGIPVCRDRSDEPPSRYDNIIYDPCTKFCRGRVYRSSIYQPGTRKLTCVLDLSLQPYEEKLCSGSEKCNTGDFLCHDGSLCVPNTMFCDGIVQCNDGSDELYYNKSIVHSNNFTACRGQSLYPHHTANICMVNSEATDILQCREPTCREIEFPCLDGSSCISFERFCNGINDCRDGSDEPPLRNNNASYSRDDTFCRGKGRFRHSRQICLLPSSVKALSTKLCDGASCKNDEFACLDGSQCIPISHFCDGRPDCIDRSDEPSQENSNVSYDGDTKFCRGHTGSFICVLPSTLVSQYEILCAGTSCRSRDFTCFDGLQCIKYWRFCDGYRNCRDGSDEPPFRNLSASYSHDVTFCRGKGRSRNNGRQMCLLPSSLKPQSTKLCDGASCQNDEFACLDGSQCIPSRLFCDGRPNCIDGSDEPPRKKSNYYYHRDTAFCRGHEGSLTCVLPPMLVPQYKTLCASRPCEDNEFSCFDGSRCISIWSFCDGKPDCTDESDEPPLRKSNSTYHRDAIFCRGRTGSFICVLPPTLVPQYKNLCDGSSCSDRQFPCSDGTQCIKGDNYCNRHDDCLDGSDEPPQRNTSEKYSSDVTFCRSIQSNYLESHYICVLLPSHVPYANAICSGTNCTPDEFPCQDGSKCIEYFGFCDGNPHCPDGSDEIYFNNSMEYNFDVRFCRMFDYSTSRICMLPEGAPVNGYTYCNDSYSVPLRSACLSNEFSCDSGSTCIEYSSFCDLQQQDCRDGTDEPWKNLERINTNGTLCRAKAPNEYYAYHMICELPVNLIPYMDELCDGNSCKPSEFSCANGRKCLMGHLFCNGYTTCEDGSDEFNLPEWANFTGRICHRNGRQCMVSDFDICDGVSECDLDLDECFCSVNETYRLENNCFQCFAEQSVVLPTSMLCNGVFDCHDLSDECLCPSAARPKICENVMWDMREGENSDIMSVRCASMENGTAILINTTRVCDSRLDCLYGIDEANCKQKDLSSQLLGGTVAARLRSIDNKRLDYECRNPVGTYATECDGIPECNDYMDEECRCDTTPEFCDYIYDDKNDPKASYLNGKVVPTCDDFKRDYRIRLSRQELCDGTSDCKDHGDERGCSARFYCTEEPTPNIAMIKKCDKQPDCDNGSDEEGCSHISCNDDGNLQYISRDAVCDGIKDCKSGFDECQPGCIESAFSDEKSMITSKAILVFSWIISLGAMIGCTGVIVITMRTTIKQLLAENVTSTSTRIKVINMLILSLSISDLLVGIYAFLISIKATQTDTNYCQVDFEWRSSSTCSALGAIMVIGSEQSVFTMVIIASQRLYSVMRPLSRSHLSIAIITVSISWIISILLGIVPLIPHIEDYFVTRIAFNENQIFKVLTYQDIQYMDMWLSLTQTSPLSRHGSTEWSRIKNMIRDVDPNVTVAYEFGYYSSHSVCLPTFSPDPAMDRAWGYSFFLLLMNFVAFLYMLVVYVLLFRHAMLTSSATGANPNNEKKNMESKRLQGKLTRIVISDFLCWIPICIIGFLSFNGVDIPKDVYLPAGLLIVPINSALNPLLYSDLPEIIWAKIKRIGRQLPASAPDQTEAVVMTER